MPKIFLDLYLKSYHFTPKLHKGHQSRIGCRQNISKSSYKPRENQVTKALIKTWACLLLGP
ncbi:hypothetical protein JN01_0651 [Entomoplasma freundtii]|uniref:Uncharacterized protein n=1 Tax=Entomoplasma freundtii TaxID=74700 RepID=A0A2K8NRN3_9MOLU|nr:hypothetical protein [Entomoplasma freundtii]ATZ16437.1 hypothetical protein EFREU_v1c04110 [Entomoplasma freundtii]TDY55967.1 hypothetical protein JN01_0651 [Entomoplasma freundtii]